MKISRLLEGADIVKQDADPTIQISGLAYDSRSVKHGDLFFAIPGFKVDGHHFIDEAITKGARAIVTEKWIEAAGVPQLKTSHARRTLAVAAANFYGHPSGKLVIIGVTGTNGKTTTTFLIDQIMQTAGKRTGLIGGIEYRIGNNVEKARRTTPEAPDIQRMLTSALENDVEVVTLEVSSHGISLHRTACLEFDAAVFTNLSHDHLDLHGNMEDYFQTKRRLFQPGPDDITFCVSRASGASKRIVNTDDAYGRRLVSELGGECITFGLSEDASFRAARVNYSGWQTSFDLITPAGNSRISMQLPGEFNIHNSLAAAALSQTMDISLELISEGLEAFRGVPGRFELIEVDAPFRVVLDYAHNEDGLLKALKTARNITLGELIAVFGCPGERDQEKRPSMGEIAGSIADLAILTTDDCYSEPPGEILDSVEEGLRKSGGTYQRYADRRQAIAAAIDAAGPDDTVFIAGKGHEEVQIMKEGPVPHSDRQVVLDLIEGI